MASNPELNVATHSTSQKDRYTPDLVSSRSASNSMRIRIRWRFVTRQPGRHLAHSDCRLAQPEFLTIWNAAQTAPPGPLPDHQPGMILPENDSGSNANEPDLGVEDRRKRTARADVPWHLSPGNGCAITRRPTNLHPGQHVFTYGGDEEDRTPDLRIANATLSQLSYVPTGRNGLRKPDKNCSPGSSVRNYA